MYKNKESTEAFVKRNELHLETMKFYESLRKYKHYSEPLAYELTFLFTLMLVRSDGMSLDESPYKESVASVRLVFDGEMLELFDEIIEEFNFLKKHDHVIFATNLGRTLRLVVGGIIKKQLDLKYDPLIHTRPKDLSSINVEPEI